MTAVENQANLIERHFVSLLSFFSLSFDLIKKKKGNFPTQQNNKGKLKAETIFVVFSSKTRNKIDFLN